MKVYVVRSGIDREIEFVTDKEEVAGAFCDKNWKDLRQPWYGEYDTEEVTMESVTNENRKFCESTGDSREDKVPE